jgi:glycosyltransferase involved in cell wall biosynthesis
MRILYLVYVQQNSFKSFCNDRITRCSWVDALLDEILKSKNLNIALGVPVNEKTLQKYKKEEITLYGLPNPTETNIFIKTFKRLTYSIETGQIINYASQVIKDFNPDIIQIFGSENPFGLIVKQQSKPVMIHIQGFLLIWQGKWFAGISKWQQFRYSSLKDLLLIRGSYNGFYTFRKRAERETIIIQECKYFIGRTSFDKRIVSLLSPNSTYFHCEEFIRKEFFERQWKYPLQSEVTCISVLKGTAYKGIELLIETFLLLMKFSSSFFEFKVCGVQENEEIVNILKKKYKKKFNFSKIKFLGNLNTIELLNQLCNSNIYIHPSYIENSPNSICEAMALGMPIIATNVGGVSTLIEDEVEGILVQEGEPFSLTGAIVDLTNNYEKAKKLGHNARTKAFKRHQPDDLLKNLLNIYNKIIYEDGRKDLS